MSLLGPRWEQDAERIQVERENPALRVVRPERKIVAAHSLHEDGVGRADLHGQVGSVEVM